MKRILFGILLLFTCLSAAFGLSGCTSSPASSSAPKGKTPIQIVCTNFAGYDFARQIAKGHADITLLIKPGTDVHSFEPTPKDIKKVENCDLFIYTGGDSDEWVDKIFSSSDQKPKAVCKMMDTVALLPEEHPEGMAEEKQDSSEKEDEDGEEEMDEHVWTSPANSIKITKAIKEKLCSIDRENATSYQKNADVYVSELSSLDNDFRDIISSSKRKEIIVGDRFPFLYFVKEYGLSYHAAFPGCSKDTESNPKTIAFLINKIKEDDIPVVFHIEMSNQQMSHSIAEATGAKDLLLNAVHNVSEEDFKKGITYVDLMKHNEDVLKEALNE